ncbi:MAG: hypothetical protein SFZ23_00980 [Planctomycetota bacterium]|nr:hypothetical protein [Planctomycetota bacterium]
MSRRGFTLLEVSLAGLLGLMLIMSVISVLRGMDRADRALARRFEENQELHRLRVSMRRAFQSVIMSRDGQPRPPRPEAEAAASTAASEPVEGELASQTRSVGAGAKQTSFPAPRLVLTYDADLGAPTMVRQGTLDPAEGPGASRPQRLEIVMEFPPVAPDTSSTPWLAGGRAGSSPVASGGASRRDRASADDTSQSASASGSEGGSALASAQSRGAGTGRSGGRASTQAGSRGESRSAASTAAQSDAAEPGEDAGAGDDLITDGDVSLEDAESAASQTAAIRGVFELRPAAERLRLEGLSEWQIEESDPGLDLWWRQIGPRQDVGEPNTTVDSGEPLSEPQLIATRLAYVKWRFFHRREWKTEHTGTWLDDLPAYVEMEVETSSGIAAKWLLEIGWIVGKEIPDPKNDQIGAAGRQVESSSDVDSGADSGAKSGASGGARPAPVRGPGAKQRALREGDAKSGGEK